MVHSAKLTRRSADFAAIATPAMLCADRGHGWRHADGRADNATDRVGETPCVFLAGLHRAERTIAERLLRLANGTQPWPLIDPDKALPWVEGRIGIALAESPRAGSRARDRFDSDCVLGTQFESSQPHHAFLL